MINVNSNLIKKDLAEIGPNAFAVLMAITVHINAKRTAFPGVPRLCMLTGLSKNTVYAAIAHLIQCGYLERWQEKKDGKFGKTIYRITTKYLGVFVSADEIEIEEEQEVETVYQNTGHGETVSQNTVSQDLGRLSINQLGSINQLRSIEEEEEEAVAKLTPEDIKDFEEQANGKVVPLTARNSKKEKSSAKKEKDSVEKWGDQILADQMYVERTCLALKITPDQFRRKWDAFILQKRALEELNHRSPNDLKKNFFFWVSKMNNFKPQYDARKNNNTKSVSEKYGDIYRKYYAEADANTGTA